ncbi:MAG TPA: hypothetical protein VLI07_05830, partial [Candidatus Binatus sp.]|nr:hypothetical protein [Candidatus Binatus sp.]
GALAYWTFAVSVLPAVSVKMQVLVLTPPLLHTPDQIAARPLSRPGDCRPTAHRPASLPS